MKVGGASEGGGASEAPLEMVAAFYRPYVGEL